MDNLGLDEDHGKQCVGPGGPLLVFSSIAYSNSYVLADCVAVVVMMMTTTKRRVEMLAEVGEISHGHKLLPVATDLDLDLDGNDWDDPYDDKIDSTTRLAMLPAVAAGAVVVVVLVIVVVAGWTPVCCLCRGRAFRL